MGEKRRRGEKRAAGAGKGSAHFRGGVGNRGKNHGNVCLYEKHAGGKWNQRVPEGVLSPTGDRGNLEKSMKKTGMRALGGRMEKKKMLAFDDFQCCRWGTGQIGVGLRKCGKTVEWRNKAASGRWLVPSR